jgi:hypothetical protein
MSITWQVKRGDLLITTARRRNSRHQPRGDCAIDCYLASSGPGLEESVEERRRLV